MIELFPSITASRGVIKFLLIIYYVMLLLSTIMILIHFFVLGFDIIFCLFYSALQDCGPLWV